MEEKIDKLHQMFKEIYPEAISVTVFVNASEIEVVPKYKTNLTDYTMRNLSGGWVKSIKN